ncbi:MAG: SDR family oxidoreductase [Gemmatimonadetes bacterium]|nr:SDR family oxidoreductase [Gemmatimonadota bacterium]
MDPAGRVALVTGGGIRVGRAIALGLAKAGARVIVHYNRSAGEAEEVVAQIRNGGGEAVAMGADLSVHGEVERLADEALAAFGGVDILVNSASIFPEEGLGDIDEALWDRTMAINLKAPFFLTQRIGLAMRARGEGVVINLGDLAGLQSWLGYAAHAVSKAGLIHFTRVAARALAPEVRVACIAPGTVLPPDDHPEDEIQRLAERAPLRRNGTPEDVVEAVLYLIGATFVTGEVLVLDGGRILRS